MRDSLNIVFQLRLFDLQLKRYTYATRSLFASLIHFSVKGGNEEQRMEVKNMVSPRIREVQDKQEMQRVVDDFMTQGYTVKEEGTESILLKKKTWGSAAGIIVSLILMVIVGVVTVFIGFLLSWLIPVIYVIYAHYNAPEVLLRIVGAQPQAPLRQTPPPPQARPPQTQTSTAGKVCISCNSTNDSSSTYCSKCGARI